MNKLVWKFTKLLLLVILMYVVAVNVTYKFSQTHKAPFKHYPNSHVAIPFEELSATRALQAEPHATIGGANSEKEPSDVDSKPVVVDGAKPLFKRTFVNTLLIAPQQKDNFSHNREAGDISQAIWPNKQQSHDDRIVSQMAYGLPETEKHRPAKQILVYTGSRDGMWTGKRSFQNQKCPVSNCELTYDRAASKTADVILWQEHASLPSGPRPARQIWAVFFLESPYHTPSLAKLNDRINWTATYRRDSTIVAPYERFTLFNSSIVELPLAKNYAKLKTKKVAWFVSNCGARNNRLGYAKELAKYIEVDIYGACGTMSCPRSTSSGCFSMLSTTYKFYLAFENSNCRDYITEKFFVNGLQNDVLPIVMGAHPDDYRNSAPKNSYIHVDDFDSPEKLAEYLLELDSNDDKYNEYFRWKGTGDNMNTYFWCRLCSMAHAADTVTSPQFYPNVDDWWRGASVCQQQSKQMWPRW